MNSIKSLDGYSIVAIIIALGLIAELITQLLAMIMMTALFAAIGYSIYLLVLYNNRTRFFSYHVDRLLKHLKIFPPKQDILEMEESDSKTLQLEDIQPAIKEQIDAELGDKYIPREEVKNELEQLRSDGIILVREEIAQFEKKVAQNSKEEVLTNIFGDKEINTTPSDVFERRQHLEVLQRKDTEIDRRDFRVEMREQLLQQNKKIDTTEYEVKTALLKIKEYVVEKFAQLEIHLTQEIALVKDEISKLKVDIKNELAQMKVQFGREIVRLDQQQLKIVGKLEAFANKIEAYGIEMQRIKNEAERFSLRGEALLMKADKLFEMNRIEVQKMSNALDVDLQKIALHKEDFANRVGQAKILIDNRAKDIEFALKDMAYERIGINALRQDYKQRMDTERLKIENLNKEKRRTEERINERLKRNGEIGDLRHKLHMTESNLQRATNKERLLRQEYGMIKRMSN